MINREEAQLSVLRQIAQKKDLKLLASIEPGWFTEDFQHIVIAWKVRTSHLSRVELEHWIQNKMNGVPKDVLDVVGEKIRLIYDVVQDLKYDAKEASNLLEVKYIQAQVDKELEDARKIIYQEDPASVILKLNERFYKIPRGRSKVRRMSQEIKVENPTLVNFGTRRPGLNKTLPMKGSFMVIGGDSGHHKSNQAIDIGLNGIEANIISNPDFHFGFFSKEMTYEEVMDRLIALKFGYTIEEVTRRAGKFDVGKVREGLQGELRWLDENFIIFGPEQFHTNSDIIKLIVENNIDTWALDYVQLFALGAAEQSKEMNSKVLETIVFIKTAVQLTNTFGVPVSQVRKKDSARYTHFPRLDDLEWSGTIKHLAHSVMMCFWPYKVFPDKCKKEIYISSWQKVRKADIFSEFQKVDASMGKFQSMPESEARLYINYLAL